MTFIRSISGFRGTIGGAEHDNLTPPDVVRSTVGYGSWILSGFSSRENRQRPLVVVGRDARPSGDMVQRLVTGTLMGMGIDILDLGLSTTPTVEMAVVGEEADGGIILTASHNPVQWNALKLLDAEGTFISADAGADVIRRSSEPHSYAEVTDLGTLTPHGGWIDAHIQAILDLDLVDRGPSPRPASKSPWTPSTARAASRSPPSSRPSGWRRWWNSIASHTVDSRTTPNHGPNTSPCCHRPSSTTDATSASSWTRTWTGWPS